jgi:hypothetical protein
VTGAGQEKVRRLDVAMDDPRLVRGREHVEELKEDRAGDLRSGCCFELRRRSFFIVVIRSA